MTDKQKFTLKMIMFLVFSLVAPATYLAIRYNLFTKVTKTTLSFWAIVIIAIILSVVGVMIKYYIGGLKTRFSFLKQLLEGLVKVILPIAMILIVAIVFKHNAEIIVSKLNLVIESISIILGCELIAICVNPLPKWAFDNNVEGITEIANKILQKKEE